jgi:hypothetical protein
VKDDRKILNREKKTPPTPPHKNPVKNMSITDHHLMITEKSFLPNKAHCPATEPHRSNHFTLKSSE